MISIGEMEDGLVVTECYPGNYSVPAVLSMFKPSLLKNREPIGFLTMKRQSFSKIIVAFSAQEPGVQLRGVESPRIVETIW